MRKKIITLLPPIIMTIVIISIVTVTTYTWLAMNEGVNTENPEMAIESDTYDLVVRRTTEYNRGIYEGIGGLKSIIGGEGYLFDYDTYTSTSDNTRLAYEIVNENDYEGDYSLMPGTYGYIDFYIRPHAGVTLVETTFEITLSGFKRSYNEVGEGNYVLSLNEVTESAKLDMLKGHFLLFEGRSSETVVSSSGTVNYYRYSDLIEDGILEFSSLGKAKSTDPGYTDCYKVTIYWCWPVTYFEINDHYIGSNPEDGEEMFPTTVATYINNHPSYFFATNQNSLDPDLRSDGYNDGDQVIGDNFNYIVVYIDGTE